MKKDYTKPGIEYIILNYKDVVSTSGEKPMDESQGSEKSPDEDDPVSFANPWREEN